MTALQFEGIGILETTECVDGAPTKPDQPDKPPSESADDPNVKLKVDPAISTLQTEMKEIWASILETKTAFRTIEDSIEGIVSRSRSNADATEARFQYLEKKIKDIDKSLDAKVVIYHEENTKLLNKRCDDTTRDLNNKINSLKQVNAKFKDNISSKVDALDISLANPNTNLKIEVDELRSKLEKIDLPLLERDLSKTTDGYSNELKDVNHRISIFQREYAKQVETFDESIIDIRNDLRRQIMSWNTNPPTIPVPIREDKELRNIVQEQMEDINVIRQFMVDTKAANVSTDVEVIQQSTESVNSKQSFNTVAEAKLSRQAFAEGNNVNDDRASHSAYDSSKEVQNVVPVVKQRITDETSELVLVMDSNSRYIDFGRSEQQTYKGKVR